MQNAGLTALVSVVFREQRQVSSNTSVSQGNGRKAATFTASAQMMNVAGVIQVRKVLCTKSGTK